MSVLSAPVSAQQGRETICLPAHRKEDRAAKVLGQRQQLNVASEFLYPGILGRVSLAN